MTYFVDVQAFHRKVCELPETLTPAIPSEDRIKLRQDLMSEEWLELHEAILANDIVEIADACADLIVTVLGTADEYGIPFDAVWSEVHRSNMAKAGGPIREDGKRLKPEGWTPPNIPKALMWGEIENRARMGAYVGRGWRQIVIDAHCQIEELHPGYEIDQIKEKFGGLRFYCGREDDQQVADILRQAERLAEQTCEACGATESVTTEGGWLKTLCPPCRGARAQRGLR